MKLTNQETRVLNYLKENKEINPLTSWTVCGVYRLAAVIHQLKTKGISIVSTRKKSLNQFNESCHYASYSLDA